MKKTIAITMLVALFIFTFGAEVSAVYAEETTEPSVIEATETPADSDRKHQSPVPQARHRVPDFLLCKTLQIQKPGFIFSRGTRRDTPCRIFPGHQVLTLTHPGRYRRLRPVHLPP